MDKAKNTPAPDERPEPESGISITFFVGLWPIATLLLIVAGSAGATLYFSQYGQYSFSFMNTEDYIDVTVLGTIIGLISLLPVVILDSTVALLICPIIYFYLNGRKNDRQKSPVRNTFFTAFTAALMITSISTFLFFIFSLFFKLFLFTNQTLYINEITVNTRNLPHSIIYTYLATITFIIILTIFISLARVKRILLILPIMSINLILPLFGSYMYFDLLNISNPKVDIHSVDMHNVVAPDNEQQFNFQQDCLDNTALWAGGKAILLQCHPDKERLSTNSLPSDSDHEQGSENHELLTKGLNKPSSVSNATGKADVAEVVSKLKNVSIKSTNIIVTISTPQNVLLIPRVEITQQGNEKPVSNSNKEEVDAVNKAIANASSSHSINSTP